MVAAYYERALDAITESAERARVADLLWHVARASFRASAFDVALRHATSVKSLTTPPTATTTNNTNDNSPSTTTTTDSPPLESTTTTTRKKNKQERFVAEYTQSTFEHRWALLVVIIIYIYIF